MKNSFNLLLAVLLTLFFQDGFSCTTFVIKSGSGEIAFGRNFDFPVGMGHIHINQRGKVKTAFIAPPEKPFEWVAKYGSISFNQIGREFPYGGMNEAGLVIEQMWLQQAVYPEADDRFGLTELQWIQYQLDNSATVDEVFATNEFLRISYTSMATLHFLVADKSGAVAAIEYLDGKMTVRKESDLPYPVLANCPYEVSEEFLQSKKNQQAKAYSGWTENSSGRFALAAEMIENFNSENINEYSFGILGAVSQGDATQWSIVYNISNGEVQFKTTGNPQIRKLKLDSFDFSCNQMILYADMNTSDLNTLNFKIYSAEENLNLLNAVCDGVELLSSLPAEVRRMQSEFPMQLECSQK
jgi:penicillin V acylase-like amidase (Ntn superfamily)